jgi:hypothetical protein
MAGRKMHQTTVRFGPDLWGEIEVEARRAGVSVAQYVRDSALLRVAYTRGRDGDPHYDAALGSIGDTSESRSGSSTADDAQALRRAGALRAGARRRDSGSGESSVQEAD